MLGGSNVNKTRRKLSSVWHRPMQLTTVAAAAFLVWAVVLLAKLAPPQQTIRAWSTPVQAPRVPAASYGVTTSSVSSHMKGVSDSLPHVGAHTGSYLPLQQKGKSASSTFDSNTSSWRLRAAQWLRTSVVAGLVLTLAYSVFLLQGKQHRAEDQWVLLGAVGKKAKKNKAAAQRRDRNAKRHAAKRKQSNAQKGKKGGHNDPLSEFTDEVCDCMHLERCKVDHYLLTKVILICVLCRGPGCRLPLGRLLLQRQTRMVV